jgi:lipopolysaccharide transport system ATP-binding protein
MSDFAIKVEGLGKKYLLQHQAAGQRYVALRDVIADKAKALFKTLKSGNSKKLKSGDAGFGVSAFQDVSISKTEEFWALKDVSFEVKPGEVVGIIGRNGAGKSTLLKILSRITEPTNGCVRLRGRVASLLEVGTGFHPELTGRENIFLNGAILGMHRTEIKAKFDEIVAFAEVEKFLDTPVKRYSSGMYVRLAFAVAAHLEPEILIVDEVLAVGDTAFQKKCLGKMNDISMGGRTILFVSHNMAATRQLCSRCILLMAGQVMVDGVVGEAIGAYLNVGGDRTEFTSFSLQAQHPDIDLVRAEINKSHLRYGEPLAIKVTLESRCSLAVGVECSLRDQTQTSLAYFGTGTLAGYEIKLKPGNNVFVINYPSLPLAQGRYSLDIGISRTAQAWYILAENAITFSIDESRPLDSGYWFAQGGRGAVFIPCEIETQNEIIRFHQ